MNRLSWKDVAIVALLIALGFSWWSRPKPQLVHEVQTLPAPERSISSVVITSRVPVAVTNSVLENTPRETWAARFNVAMDRELARLAARREAATDAEEQARIRELEAALTKTEETWARFDAAKSPAERQAIQKELQPLTTELMRLTHADREARLRKLAESAGVTEPEAQAKFIVDAEAALRDTQLDWAQFFQRAR